MLGSTLRLVRTDLNRGFGALLPVGFHLSSRGSETLISCVCLNVPLWQFSILHSPAYPFHFFIAFTLLSLRGLLRLQESILPAKHLKILGRRMLWQRRTLYCCCLGGGSMRSWLTTVPVVTSYSAVQQPLQIWSCLQNNIKHPSSAPLLKSLSGEK